MTTNEQAVNLYWAYTDDHDEDWFVFAASAREARAFHDNYETTVGRRPGSADRTGVKCTIPGPCWSSRIMGFV
jgi:hypothetical protein